MLRLLAFFLLSSIAYSTGEFEITICYKGCPSDPKGTPIVYNDGDDLDAAVKEYLVQDTDIYFYTADRGEVDFKFDLLTFSNLKVSFNQFPLSLNFDIYIDIDNGHSTGKLAFDSVDVYFVSDHGTQLRIDTLEFKDCQIELQGVDSELYTASLTTDDSIHSFTQVHLVDAQYEQTQLTYDVTSSGDTNITVGDKTFTVLINNKKTRFTYSSDDMVANLETSAGSKCFVEFTGGSSSKVPSITFKNFPNLIFLGNWPESALMSVTDKNLNRDISISSYSSILPISRIGTSNTTISINQSTTISGDINVPVTFALLRDRFLSEMLVNIKGKFSGSSLDLGSSYIRLEIGELDIDFTKNVYPFIFRVGTGGASTVSCPKTTATSTRMNQFTIYTDFNKLLTDFELDALISKEWNLLYLNMTLEVSSVKILLRSDPFIHGFVPNDCCMTLLRFGQNFTLTTIAPSSLPLNICYDGDQTTCDDGTYGAEIHEINQLTKYFDTNCKVLRLTLKVSISDLDFSDFDVGYSNCRVTIVGGYQITVNKVSYGMQKGIDYMEFDSIRFDGFTSFYINELKFLHCNATSACRFYFQNDKLVTGDDDFVRTFLDHISDLPLEYFRYQMDHYDAISVDDEQWTFYDLDVNDISDPITIKYDDVKNKFVSILYDVGMTSTAMENNLNITMNTKTPPSFNITFDVLSYDYRNEAELFLYKWSQTKDAGFKVYFDHGNYPVKIVLTEPYNASQLKVIGDGKVTYVDQYSNVRNLCACEGGNCGSCPANATQIAYSELDANLKDANFDLFNVAIYQSDVATTKPTVSLESLDKKTVNFVGLGPNKQDIIIINNDQSKEVEAKLTTTHFTNLKIQTSGSTTGLFFGELTLADCEVDAALKNVDLKVDDIYCNFSDFQLFKSVTVADNCFVTGKLATEAQTVKFLADQDSHDLHATLVTDATIELGNMYVKIGQTKFSISRSLVYDAVININSGKSVQFTKAEGADDTSIPLIFLNETKGSSITFCDGWSSQTAMGNKYIFLLEQIDGVTLNFLGENTPLAVSAPVGNLNIVCKAANVGIAGFFEITPSSLSETSNIAISYSSEVTKATLKFNREFDFGNQCTVQLAQPNLNVEIERLIGNQDDSEIIVESYSDLDGDSKLTVNKPFKKAQISTKYKIHCSVNKPLNNQDVINYINNKHVLFKVNTQDSSKMKQSSLDFIGQIPQTHGFTSTNMVITPNTATGEIAFGFIVNPTDVPWSLCYSTRQTCEIPIDEVSISKIDTLLPGGKMNISVTFGAANTNPLELSFASFLGSSLSISSYTASVIKVNIKLSKSIISSVSLERIELVNQNPDFSISTISLTDNSKTDYLTNFKNVTVDFSSWTALSVSTFENPIEIEYSKSDLTFTSNGFQLESGGEILISNFPKIQVNFVSNNVNLHIASGAKLLQPMKIITKSRTINVDAGFESLLSTSPIITIESNVQSKDVTVVTKSFPFIAIPYLMNAGTIKFASGSLPFTTTEPFILKDMNPILDLSSTSIANVGTYTAKSIDFEGTSSLVAKNMDVSQYPIVVDTINVKAQTNAVLSNVKVSSLNVISDSTLSGIINVKDSVVTFQWKLNEMPSIDFQFSTYPTDFVPSKVVIKFIGTETDESIDAAKYNEYLYLKAFYLASNIYNKCDAWVGKVELDSKVSYFNRTNSIFDITCNSNRLVLTGRREIPVNPPTSTSGGGGDDDHDGKKHGLSGGAIAAIVIVVIAAVAVACVFGFMYYRKKKNAYDSLDSVKLELNKQQYI